jgi:hypothetical protein
VAVGCFDAHTTKSEAFTKVLAGDIVIFHQGGTYVGVGRIGTTFVDE